MKVLNIGSLNIDYSYAVENMVQCGETVLAKGLRTGSGGKGLNQSIALRKAGMEVMHAGKIGRDGLFLRETLQEAGVDTSCIQVGEEYTGHAMIQVNAQGDNAIVVYSGANGCLDMDLVNRWLEKCDPTVDAVLLQNETNLVAEIIEAAYARGIRVAFNASPADTAICEYPLNHVTWLFVNETEAAVISGKTEETDMICRLTAKYPGAEVILTLGEDGCLVSDGKRTIAGKAVPSEAVDTTGAGDTFTGYYLKSRMTGESIEEAVRTASAAAAITVSRPGAASSIPYAEEVEEAMKKL